MTTKVIGILQNLHFMEGASLNVLKQLARGVKVRNINPGQVIMDEGSIGRDMFLILEGIVEVVKGQGKDSTVLASRGPGDVIGEMGFIESRIQEPQLLQRVIQVISARLRESDLQMIADLHLKNQELEKAYQELKEAQFELIEKERLERELELARELQQSILPKEFPHLPGLDFAARNSPARQLGGDFYDVIQLNNKRVGIVIADVADKGIVAALYMALARSLIRAEAKRNPSPRQVLLGVNKLLIEMSQADMFVTVFYGVLDTVDGAIVYARAGHDPPLLAHPGTSEVQFLQAKGTLLGSVQNIEMEEARVNFLPDDLLVLYTDGIIDANSPNGKFFTIERLLESISRHCSLDPHSLCDLLFEQVVSFQGEASQYDDMTLLVVKRYKVD
jgi:serine phosphatase RsbU (regulator of sigma subunit)